MNAEDDAAFSVLVFEEQVARVSQLVEKGAVTVNGAHELRVRLNEARLQRALAVGADDEVDRLLAARIELAREQVARVRRLADKGVLTEDDIEATEHAARETAIAAARIRGDDTAIARLLEAQVAAATAHVEKQQRLYDRRAVTRTELARGRLHLATLKNRLAAARKQEE